MKIALLGYGKMGKAIEEVAMQRGHEIVLKVSIENVEDNTIENIRLADVAIEFTGPQSAYDNVMRSMDAGIPVVCGSTGWLQEYEKAKQYCLQHEGSFLYASNFSVGVNVFFAINQKLAELMAAHDYDVAIKEIHHTEKKDAPSGTAITLAEQILKKIPYKKNWINQSSNDDKDLVITSERKDPAYGTHHVLYTSPIDTIEIIHTSYSRKGFATGAVLAAEFIKGKKGIFSMKDVLGL